jgi:hypothetical protein
MLEVTLVSERWPLRHINRIAGGVAALAAAWGTAILLYETLVANNGPVTSGQFGAALVCMGVVQVAFYVVLSGWPFRRIGSEPLRIGSANLAVIAGGFALYVALARVAGLTPATISAVAGSVIAAGLVLGMLFEGWLHSMVAELAGVAVAAALLYVALRGYAHAVGWTHAEPQEWVAYAGLNAIGAGVILHVAIGKRWPFASPAKTGVAR